MYVLILGFACYLRAELYNTGMRRSIWIATPSGVQQYQSQFIPAHAVHQPMTLPYHKDVEEDFDHTYMSPSRSRYERNVLRPDFRDIDDRVGRKSTFERLKAGTYDALFGGGFGRIIVYLLVAGIFVVVGYQVRKHEEYGGYIRLPAEEH